MHFKIRQIHFREEEMQLAVQRRRLEIVDQYRTRKLHELQSTLFVKPVRPPDETYNINVTLAESIPLDREIPDTRPESCRYGNRTRSLFFKR